MTDGILGGTFVPCQVWSMGFFDENVVGSSNALIGGWGNAGGGITYFLMPQIYDSLVRDQGLDSNVAWRVAFIVPFILIVATAAGMFFFCDDTPTGSSPILSTFTSLASLSSLALWQSPTIRHTYQKPSENAPKSFLGSDHISYAARANTTDQFVGYEVAYRSLMWMCLGRRC